MRVAHTMPLIDSVCRPNHTGSDLGRDPTYGFQIILENEFILSYYWY